MGIFLSGEMEEAIRPHTKGIVCTHASNLTGNGVDLEKVGEIARRHGLYLVADVSQTAGVWPVDVQKMHIDVLCFTGHKSLLGPQGTGGIYVREGIEVAPLLSGGSGGNSYEKSHPAEMPERLEAGTLNGPGIAGLGAALSWLEQKGLDAVRERELALMRRFYQGVLKFRK